MSDFTTLESRLRRHAAEYAATLRPRDEIHDDIDGDCVRPFWPYLIEELAKLHLDLDLRIGCVSVWVVVCEVSHGYIRRLPSEEFRKHTAIVGYQDDGEGGWLELGTCRGCGSTLAIPATKTDRLSNNEERAP